MKKFMRTTALWLCAIVATGFSAALTASDFASLVGSSEVYTLVNLHPDEENKRLYTVNYQLASVLPVCTKVTLVKLKKKVLTFRIPERGDREYEYLLHKSLPQEFTEHLAQIFGAKCPQDKIAKMAKVDQEGIKNGKPVIGMSKEAVLIAMGPPPMHVVYSTDLNEWTYWQNKFGKMRVEFNDKGKVSNIVD